MGCGQRADPQCSQAAAAEMHEALEPRAKRSPSLSSPCSPQLPPIAMEPLGQPASGAPALSLLAQCLQDVLGRPPEAGVDAGGLEVLRQTAQVRAQGRCSLLPPLLPPPPPAA